ncbi:hypothetical protein [Erysipelothrix rhusiopathiae]|uniref:hypothetical protein n=1 Tax=Erysipelothrix rhusiopathiae TaxID=1648 RepID=UPI003BF471AA
MKNIVIANSFTNAEVEGLEVLSNGGENFERAICTDEISTAIEMYPQYNLKKYINENIEVITLIETTNFIIIPSNITYGYSGEGSRGLVRVLKEFDVLSERLEEQIYNFKTKSLLIYPSGFEYELYI